MKVFTVTCIACLLLIVVGIIYIQWETKNFVKGLPNLPTTPADPEKIEHNPAIIVPGAAEDVHSGLSVEDNSRSSEIETSSDETVNAEIPTEKNIRTQREVYDWRNDDTHLHEHPHRIDPWQSVADRKALRAERPNISVEELRSQLVERFGDIPQVHTYVDLREKLADPETTLTLDEHIVHAESMNYLFPSRKTEQSIKALRKVRRALGNQ